MRKFNGLSRLKPEWGTPNYTQTTSKWFLPVYLTVHEIKTVRDWYMHIFVDYAERNVRRLLNAKV